MHLIRMELENFKSFGGEVTIPLEEGFTAITGPNGSGKSNTLDALEFVLGPKSTKSLRAENVTQLIFNAMIVRRVMPPLVAIFLRYLNYL